MSTLSENHCFICLASVGLKSELKQKKKRKTSSSADLKKKEVCDQFQKSLSTFINLKINLADFKNVYNNKRQWQNNLCCDDCFVSVEKFCETFESYQCLQMELFQMLESFSTRMKRKTKSNASTQFQKDFICKVHQKIQGEFPKGNILDKINSSSSTTITQGTSASASNSTALVDKAKCDDNDDDDFNMNSDCDEFPLLQDKDLVNIQVEDSIGEDEDIVGKVLDMETANGNRNVSNSNSRNKKGHPSGGDVEKQRKTPRKLGANEKKMPNNGKDYGPTVSSLNWQQRYHCLMCTKSFLKRRSLLLHLRRHADERVYHCRVCWKECLTPELLTGHQIRIHRVTTDDETIMCEICNEIFGHAAAHNRHLVNVHGAEKKFVCENEGCGQKFFTHQCLVRHKKVHLNKTERPFECDLCPARFKLKEHLRTHWNQVHNPEYKERKKLREKEKPNICEVCGRTFGQSQHLSRHKALVHGEKNGVDVTKIRNRDIKQNFKCHFENCGKAFTARTRLKDHIASHMGERNHQCDHCGNSYMQLTTLRKHIKYKHSETKVAKKKNFKCHYENCGYACLSKSTLIGHLAIHTGEKNFQCQHCGKNYAQQINLRNHLKKFHSETPKNFLCGQCGKGFDSAWQLSLHEAQVHKNGANVAASAAKAQDECK